MTANYAVRSRRSRSSPQIPKCGGASTVSPTLPRLQRQSTRRPLLPRAALNGWNLNRRNLCNRNSLFLLVSHSAVSRGESSPSTHLAGTPSPATGRGFAACAHPAQLPLHRVSISRDRGRVARPALCLRAVGGLWGHHCGNTRLACPDIAAHCIRHCHRMDLQSLGYSRSLQCFLPGQSRRAHGGPAWFYLFHSDFHRAPTADHARTRFPDSSAT